MSPVYPCRHPCKRSIKKEKIKSTFLREKKNLWNAVYKKDMKPLKYHEAIDIGWIKKINKQHRILHAIKKEEKNTKKVSGPYYYLIFKTINQRLSSY